MSWRLAAAFLLPALLCTADDGAIWKEFGLVDQQSSSSPRSSLTSYRFKDTTGALAAWYWLRPADAHVCDLAPYCAQTREKTLIFDANYVLDFRGKPPAKKALDTQLASLPNQVDTALPALLTYIPTKNLVPNTARYILGQASLSNFVPELASNDAGFNQGAEALTTVYNEGGSKTRLVLFYYATPEMARAHLASFRKIAHIEAKRSALLVAVVINPPSPAVADTILGRVEFTAKITFNDAPPPSPIKPLYQLFMNIIILSCVVVSLCLVAGLIYAGMRIYRRRYGTLEADEAMTTLGLGGE